MAIDIDSMQIIASDECIKKEIAFKTNTFNTTVTYDSFIALAIKLQDLLLMEPGTNPSAIDMGIGISNYRMEFLDSVTMNELQRNTLEQIRKYLPTSDIRTIEYINKKDINDKNTLYIVVYLNKTAEEFGSDVFAMGISNNIKYTSKQAFPEIYI